MVNKAGQNTSVSPPCIARSGEWTDWICTFIAAALLYGFTAAPGVLWGDHGEVQLRVLLGAWEDAREVVRAHVPYYFAATLVRTVLGADAAWAANLTAALAGAVTIANFGGTIRLMVRSRTAQWTGIALLMFSHTLWQLSASAEVISFTTMCLSLELLMVVRWLKTGVAHWLIVAALANGIGWSTHNLALLTLPAYGVVLYAHRQLPSSVGRRTGIMAAAAWLIGAAPIIGLGIKEYFKLGTVVDALRSVFVGIYATEVFNHDIGGNLISRAAAYFALNFPTPLLFLAPVGWWLLRRKAPRGAWLFLTIAGVTHLLFAARYTVPDQYTFFVPTYMFVVMFISIGVDGCVCRWHNRSTKAVLAALAMLAPAAYAAGPAAGRWLGGTWIAVPQREVPYRDPYVWFLVPWRTGYRGAERYAKEVLVALPPGAVLLADSTMRRPIQYAQAAGLRPDVTIVDAYIQSGPRPLSPVAADEGAALAAAGALYATSCAEGYAPAWLLEDAFTCVPEGVVLQVRAPNTAP